MKGKVTFRDLLNSGKKFVGTYMQFASEDILEVIALSGMDYVIFDNEHPMMSQSELRRLIRIADGLGIASMVRVSGVYETEIKHVLDAGCCAISVPNINCLEDAKKVVEYARFAPVGYRGICEPARANQFGFAYNAQDYVKQSNEDVVILCAIEGPQALAEMEDIVSFLASTFTLWALAICPAAWVFPASMTTLVSPARLTKSMSWPLPTGNMRLSPPWIPRLAASA